MKVAINLTRLVPAAAGAGGAGWFAVHCALALAEQLETSVFVSRRNADWLRRELSGVHHIEYYVFDDNFEEKASIILESFDAYIDPLNGLEPARIPESTVSIAVIHDLLFFDHPEFFEQAELGWRSLNYGSAIQRADVVLTVSSAQAKRIEAVYGKTAVFPVLQPPYFAPTIEAGELRFDPSSKIIFFPSVQWNHKNHFRLYKAFLHLCAVGAIPDNVRLLVSRVSPVEANTGLHRAEAAGDSLGDRIIEVPYLTRAEYGAVLAAAHGIVYPTMYEGYGIPVVEALLSGIPVLTPEVPAFETLRRRPKHLHILSDPANERQLADELKSFVLNAERVTADSSVCATSMSEFNESLVQAATSAVKSATSVAARGVRTPAAPIAKRYVPGLTAHVIVPEGSNLNEVANSLSGIEGGGIAQVICHASWRDLDTLKHRSPKERIEWSFYGADKDSLSRSLLYQLVFNKTEMVAIVDVRSAASDIRRASDAAKMLGPDTAPIIARFGEAATATSPREEGLAGLLAGHVMSLKRTPIPVSSTLIEYMKQAQRLVANAKPIASERMFIVDPALRDAVGHHFGVARHMTRGAKAIGMTPIVLANWHCPATIFGHESEARPSFSDYLYSGLGDTGLFVHELQEAMSPLLVCAEDVITLFCATPAMLAGSATFLAQLPPSRRPKVVIRFDRDESRTPASPISYRKAFELIQLFGLSNRYHLFVESKGLADYFQKLSGLRFPLLFNPMPEDDNALARAGFSHVETGERGRLSVGCLGEARAEKGFHHLPEVVRLVRRNGGSARQVDFVIQTGASTQNDTPSIAAARAELEEMAVSDPGLRLVDSLPGAEYDRTLRTLDLLLLPYDVASYSLRGSGVATEALAAGKVFIAPRGTDIAATFAGAGLVEAKSTRPTALAEAVGKAVAELEAERTKAKQFQTDHPEYVVDSIGFVERMVGVSHLSGKEEPTKRMALWLSNDTRGQGSQSVYDAQIDYLEARGFTVIQLHIPYPNRDNADSEAEFDWRAFLDSLCWRPGFRPSEDYYRIADAIQREGNSYDRFTAAWRHLNFPRPLHQFLNSIHFDLVVVNYAHHKEVLNTLDLQINCPIIVESHDIQSYQYAIQQKRDVDRDEIRQELHALKQFDHVVSISSSEAKLFEQELGTDKVSWILPFGKPGDVIKGEEPLLNARNVDILIVASNHDANVDSVQWFLEDVYKPHLYRHGVTLRIVGSVSQRLDSSWMADKVDYAGVVRFLDPHYSAALVVALPIVAGAGVPIKVLDAFARGAAFSMTDFAAEALDLPDSFPTVATAQEMADDIVRLLASADARLGRAKAGRAYFVKNASRRSYFDRWDAVTRAVGLDADCASPAPDEGLPPIRVDRNRLRLHSLHAPTVLVSTLQRKAGTASRLLAERVLKKL